MRRKRKNDWGAHLDINKKRKKKRSKVPKQHKEIKRESSNIKKTNHYISKDKVSKKLYDFRILYFERKSLINCRWLLNPMCKKIMNESYKDLDKRYMELKVSLMKDFEKAGRNLFRYYKFRRYPKYIKDEFLSHSMERMWYYEYFYKFDITYTKEGFSWLTETHKNYFKQVINDINEYGDLRDKRRKYRVFEFENSNTERSLSDIDVGSFVKGLKQSYEDLAQDD